MPIFGLSAGRLVIPDGHGHTQLTSAAFWQRSLALVPNGPPPVLLDSARDTGQAKPKNGHL